MDVSPDSLAALNARIVACERCPELRSYCAEVARVRRRAYADHEYWGKPVPSFGDEQARVLVLGLAPGAHGSNRTGRPFTGDESGFASQARATGREDGMKLTGLWISAVVRCAPPANKPTPGELRNCAPWLDEEIALLRDLRVVVCLGKIAFDGFLNHQLRAGRIAARAGFEFRHGAEYAMPGGITLLASYHPSLQNTNTGKLTRAMFLDGFERARQAAGSG
jgi:uracil-DNA glycosylase family 4